MSSTSQVRFVSALLAAALSSYAQISQASLEGTVKDGSGAAIPGARDYAPQQGHGRNPEHRQRSWRPILVPESRPGGIYTERRVSKASRHF